MKPFATKKQLRFNQKGQALLLSLLILAGVSAAGISFATLIINQIKASENIDNAILAQYAAESGLERSLYTIKVNRLNKEKDLTGTIDDIKAVSVNFTEVSGLSMDIDSNAVSSEEESQEFSLKKDQSKQIDLYNPDDPFGGGAVIKKLWISWDNNPYPFEGGAQLYSDGFGNGSEWVEISWTGWDADGNSYENVNKLLLASNELEFIDLGDAGGCPPNVSTKQCQRIDLTEPFAPEIIVFYRVRVKALYADVDQIEVKPLDGGYNPLDLPARVHVKTIGSFGWTKQALSASLPWKIPVAGIFDYVIFTKEVLEKTPVSGYLSSGPIEIERSIAEDNTIKACDTGADAGKICEGDDDCENNDCVLAESCVCRRRSETDSCGRYPDCVRSGASNPSQPACGLLGLGPPLLGFPPSVGDTQVSFPNNPWYPTSELYWEPLLSCHINEEADFSDDGSTSSSGWGTCTINYQEQCTDTQKVMIKKKIREEDLPEGDGEYYLSIRGLYNSNQNAEEILAKVEECDAEGCAEKDSVFIRDLYSSYVFDNLTSYNRCVSRNTISLKAGDYISFEHGNEIGNSTHLDWYQFSNSIPSDIEKKCDYGVNSGRVQIEADIPKSEPTSECECDNLTCPDPGECVDLGWNPADFGDSEEPYAQCYKYDGGEFTGWENEPHEWGACELDYNRWIEIDVPDGIPTGSYYLSVRPGFTFGVASDRLYVDVLLSGVIQQTLSAVDLGSNEFMECQFPQAIELGPNYSLMFRPYNTSIYVDWFQITDTPPQYHPCDKEISATPWPW